MSSMRCEKILWECILFVLSCGTLAINYVYKQLEYFVFLQTVPEILSRKYFKPCWVRSFATPFLLFPSERNDIRKRNTVSCALISSSDQVNLTCTRILSTTLSQSLLPRLVWEIIVSSWITASFYYSSFYLVPTFHHLLSILANFCGHYFSLTPTTWNHLYLISFASMVTNNARNKSRGDDETWSIFWLHVWLKNTMRIEREFEKYIDRPSVHLIVRSFNEKWINIGLHRLVSTASRKRATYSCTYRFSWRVLVREKVVNVACEAFSVVFRNNHGAEECWGFLLDQVIVTKLVW